MFNKKLFLFGSLAVLLVALFVAAGSAMATIQTQCGIMDNSINFGGLTVKKDVFCEGSRTWNWRIEKTVDQTSLTLSPGQSHQVNYTVTASAEAIGSYNIEGTIVVTNSSRASISVAEVTDTLADSITCLTVPDRLPFEFPILLVPGQSISCTYSGSLDNAAPLNTATAVTADGVPYYGYSEIDWSLGNITESDQCATISDTYTDFPGLPDTVCANGQTTFTYEYSRQIGPYEACSNDTIVNIASFVTNDTGATGSDDAIVDIYVPCASGCSLTPGYWKTHSIFGPAPYDDTWAQIGENTIFFLSGQSYYNVLWTSPNGNAYYILAHAYIAAKLNQLNGADFTAAQAAFDQATVLFQTYTPAQIGALRGSSALRQQFISLATTLDNYNNGLIGPGHCSE